MSEWAEKSKQTLMDRRGKEGAWGYRKDLGPSTEATALACLGLMSSWTSPPQAQEASGVTRASEWLLSVRRSDGSFGVAGADDDRGPGWPTPFPLFVWGGLCVHEAARREAVAWLLAHQGLGLPLEKGPQKVVGHDSTIVGWPWIEATHSWLEPTALAVLALCQEGQALNPRTAEGLSLIADRALAHGGWNYGNTSVFGRELRPQPAPTGLALLALAAGASRSRMQVVEPAITYLHATLPTVRAPISLGWGILGLRAWEESPTEAESWLAESFRRHGNRPDATVGLALSLLAAGPLAMTLLLGRRRSPPKGTPEPLTPNPSRAGAAP